MTPPLYQVVDWNDYFENNKSRLRDQCGFVCVPNKHGGSGLSNVMGEPDGAAIYGVWMWILQLCSRQRRPREGYLTANGKKDGRRLTTRELSNQFRRDIKEIERCLWVVCSPEVGFMQVVDGQHEFTTGAPKGHPTNTTRIYNEHSEDSPRSEQGQNAAGQPAGTAVPPECPASVSSGDTERKKERKNLSLSDEAKVAKVDTIGATEGQSNGTGEAPEGHSEGTDLIQHAEAKKLFGELSAAAFGEPLRETQWPNDMEHWLDQALPMKRESFELIDWFYRQPPDHEIFKVTRRRQSMRTLIEHLQSEPQKIRSARQSIGLNGLKPVDAAEPGDGWTPARREAFVSKFGEDRQFPKKFSELGASVCRQLDAEAKQS